MIEQFLPAFRNLCLFILEYEVITSDNDLLAIQGRRNTVSHDIFHFGMQFFMHQLLAGCLTYHCLCHGMREMLLQAGSNPKQLIRRLPVKGYHICHRRLCLGQSTGLVKYDGRGICHSL